MDKSESKPTKNGTKHLRISKDNKWDNRDVWELKDINIGNKQHLQIMDGSINNRDGLNVPILNVFEFQTTNYKNLTQYAKKIKQQFKRTLDHILDVAGKVKKGSALSSVMNFLVNEDLKDIEKINKTVGKIEDEFKIDYESYENDIFREPILDNKYAFDGKYIRSYQMPYNIESGDTYFLADGRSGWGELGVSDMKFLGNTKLQNIFKAATSIIDTPLLPNWNSTQAYGAGSAYTSIGTKFHLVNNTFDNLVNNFTYLSHLFQGCLWVQYETFRVPPNVFSVEIPGFIFLQYATAVINVRSVGNKRIINNKDILKTKFKKTGYSLFNDSKDHIFFPDAWEVEIIFKSLLPNSFNSIMNYFQNRYGKHGEDFRNNITVGSFTIGGEDGVSVNTNKELQNAQKSAASKPNKKG